MTTYSINTAELLLLGLTSGLASGGLGWAVFFYQKATELRAKPGYDAEFLAYCYTMVHFSAVVAIVLYVVFGVVIFKIKWSSGQRTLRQLILGD